MDGTVIEYFDKYLDDKSFNGLINHLVDNKLLDQKKIRNIMIAGHFLDSYRFNKLKLTTIYDDLSYKYNLSYSQIRLIISKASTFLPTS